MAKIYVKTILLVIAVTGLALLRLGLLRVADPFPDYVSNIFIATGVTAVLINEKLTRGERWKRGYIALLILAILFWCGIFLSLAGFF